LGGIVNMTAHYLLCRVFGSFDEIAQYLGKYFGNVHRKQWNTTDGKAAVFLGESYFIRSNSNAAILMILKETSPSEAELEVISCAGASGVMELSWGAHGAYVKRIIESLQRAGLKVEVQKEIANYEGAVTGADGWGK
jgi:phytoene dehydrogenase-like protein